MSGRARQADGSYCSMNTNFSRGKENLTLCHACVLCLLLKSMIYLMIYNHPERSRAPLQLPSFGRVTFFECDCVHQELQLNKSLLEKKVDAQNSDITRKANFYSVLYLINVCKCGPAFSQYIQHIYSFKKGTQLWKRNL